MPATEIMDLERRCLTASDYLHSGWRRKIAGLVGPLIPAVVGWFLYRQALPDLESYMYILMCAGLYVVGVVGWLLLERKGRKHLRYDLMTTVCREGRTLTIQRSTKALVIPVEDIQFVQWCMWRNTFQDERGERVQPYTVIHYKPFNREAISGVIIQTRSDLEWLLPDVDIRNANCDDYLTPDEKKRKDAINKWLDEPI